MTSLATPLRIEPVPDPTAPFSSWPKVGRPAGFYPADTLGEEATDFFRDQGFLVAENALSPAEVEELNEETLRICRNESGDVQGIDPAARGETDQEVLARVLCIHFPHKINTVMRRALSHPAIVNVLTRTISPNVKAMQSMLFVKASGKPGQAWHTDADSAPVEVKAGSVVFFNGYLLHRSLPNRARGGFCRSLVNH